jgi:exodeoxyribonuclease VII large subunit
MIGAAARSRLLTVSELTARLAETLEREYGVVWVAGEISSCRRAASGHVYFVLKDAHSQLGAVCFRRTLAALRFVPGDGIEVVVAGRVGLYPERGALQLYVETMEPLGLGALRLAFEQLKDRLEAEGLFAAARKRTLPRFPGVVGVVTALRGAAVRDILRVLGDRWPTARVVVRPVRVQGAEAAADVAAGIAELTALPEVEVVIVGRGGGSLEDLWAFNTEAVARAIVASPVPVISAVGHEIDVTIADYAADVRAPTPTAAGVLAVPDRHELGRAVGETAVRLQRSLARRVAAAREHLERYRRAVGAQRRRLEEHAIRADELAGRARRALQQRLAWERREIRRAADRLTAAHPATRLARAREQVHAVAARLARTVRRSVGDARVRLGGAAGKLDVLSPLASLARGYAIVRREDGRVVRDAATLTAGDVVALLLARGRARARIVDVEEGE